MEDYEPRHSEYVVSDRKYEVRVTERGRAIIHREITGTLLIKTRKQRAQRGTAAAKSEARNTKSETNSNDQNSNEINEF